MPENPISPPGPSPEEVSQAKRLHAAFVGVFGFEGRRNADQNLVMEHLAKVGFLDTRGFQSGANGLMDAFADAHRDGARTIALIVGRQLKLASKDLAGKKKPKSRRE